MRTGYLVLESSEQIGLCLHWPLQLEPFAEDQKMRTSSRCSEMPFISSTAEVLFQLFLTDKLSLWRWGELQWTDWSFLKSSGIFQRFGVGFFFSFVDTEVSLKLQTRYAVFAVFKAGCYIPGAFWHAIILSGMFSKDDNRSSPWKMSRCILNNQKLIRFN